MKVISAEGLPLARKPPKAYVKIAFEDHKWKTQTANRGVQPSWNETFQLRASLVYLNNYVLTFGKDCAKSIISYLARGRA